MKKKSTGKGLMFSGRLRKSGLTIYMRQGQMIARTAISEERRSNTRAQFIQRQKMRHSVELWKMLRFCEVLMFTERKTVYQNFMSLANRLPVVYVPNNGLMGNASFLMPDIPVSDGTLPVVKQELGEVDGTPALLTSLKVDERSDHAKLLLYTAVQTFEHDMPRVRFSIREVSWWDMNVVDGRLALVGEEFSDEQKGWALVKVTDGRCSPQAIVTRCTLYEQYTTEEALEAAADSYGGLTGNYFLSPG